MDMPSFTNRIAGRIALRGAMPKMLLGFGAMALLLVLVTFAMRSLNGSGEANQTAKSTAATDANATTSPANGVSSGTTNPATSPTTITGSARPFPKAASKTNSSEASTSPLGALLIGIALLGALVAVLFIAAKFMRKARMLPSSRKQQLKLQDVLSLGPKKALYVVGFEGRTLLISAAGEGVSLIADYSAEELGVESVTAPAISTPTVAINTAAEDEPESSQATNASVITTNAPSVATKRSTAPARAISTAAATRPERVPPAFRHLLERAQSVEMEA
ncbi:MAG: hypothetical protein EXS14_10345 [Planctomycetes bacterium]|nr:hypothetical protein [Planctomycetota bacterium]